MILLSLIAGAVDGTVEALLINYRTRQGRQDLPHTWILYARAAGILAIGILYNREPWEWVPFILLTLSAMLLWASMHALLINQVRRMAYPYMPFFAMKDDGLDYIWVKALGSQKAAYIGSILCYFTGGIAIKYLFL